MNLLTYLMESRGVVNSVQRIPTIATRFGLSAGKMEQALKRYVEIADRFGTVPTLAVTANLVERYPRVFATLAERGVELAIHGYVHTDYSRLDFQQQRAHLEQGLARFRRLGITVTGFRWPYVRWNDDSVKAAKESGLRYGSNRTVVWDVLPASDGLSPQALRAYRKGLLLYGAREAADVISLPAFVDGLLDLPASLPDDEALVDRLRAGSAQREAMWRSILDEVYGLGELFVLILHHERVGICGSALEAVLSHTQRRDPPVWLAPMTAISDWWLRRASYRLRIDRVGEQRFRAIAPPDPDVTVLGRGIEAEAGLRPWYGQYALIPTPEFTFQCTEMPCIGVDSEAAPALVQFLEEEGFVVRRGDADRCALYLDGWTQFCETDKRPVIDLIEESSAPLLRLWRWPRGARCAVSLTGDVDSMTLIDFLRRPLEV